MRTATKADMAELGEPYVLPNAPLFYRLVSLGIAPKRPARLWESQWVHLAAMLALIAIGTLIAHLTGRPLAVFDR
jgi:hypothetical protein